MSKKIILLNPNSHPSKSGGIGQPIGLLSIAGTLRKEHKVSIMDANVLNLSEQEIISTILTTNPDILGITTLTPTINQSLRIAKTIKKLRKNTKIILGGVHATVFANDIVELPYVDSVIKGEGEEVIFDAIEGDGVFSKSIKDLNTLPLPAWNMINFDNYRNSLCKGRFAMVMASRGCPYSCIFCSGSLVSGKKVRRKNKDKIATEIGMLINYKTFNVKTILFEDDIFTLDKNWVYGICEYFKSWKKLGKKYSLDGWWCNTRVDLLDSDLLRVMKEANCKGICLGIESGDQEILDKMKKNITLEEIEDGVRLIKEVGLKSYGYFMIGNLDDTNETIRKTIDFAKKLPLDYAQFSMCTPFPGSELFEIGQKRGVISKNPDWTNYDWEGDPPNVSLVSNKERRDWYNRALREFYFRPKQILKNLNLEAIKIGLRMLRND
jgi:anaerobic magnesium-protoporphyrin IX monomethyl ester cyclase